MAAAATNESSEWPNAAWVPNKEIKRGVVTTIEINVCEGCGGQVTSWNHFDQGITCINCAGSHCFKCHQLNAKIAGVVGDRNHTHAASYLRRVRARVAQVELRVLAELRARVASSWQVFCMHSIQRSKMQQLLMQKDQTEAPHTKTLTFRKLQRLTVGCGRHHRFSHAPMGESICCCIRLQLGRLAGRTKLLCGLSKTLSAHLWHLRKSRAVSFVQMFSRRHLR